MSQIVLNLLSRPPIYGTSEWQNTLLRQSNFPIDKSSTWTSYDLAVEYAATDLTAYAGQIISVNENDKVLIYKLVPDTTKNVNFVLEEIASGSSISSLGNWSIETRVDGLVSDFNYDLYLNFPANSTVTLSIPTEETDGTLTKVFIDESIPTGNNVILKEVWVNGTTKVTSSIEVYCFHCGDYISGGPVSSECCGSRIGNFRVNGEAITDGASYAVFEVLDNPNNSNILASNLALGETFSTAPVIFSQGNLQLSILSSDGSSTYATYLLEETSNIDGLRSGIFIEQ